MTHTPGPYKPFGPCYLITSLSEGRPTRKRFYGAEAKVEKWLENIAYFANEGDAELFIAAPDLLAACEAAASFLHWYEGEGPELKTSAREIALICDTAIAKAEGDTDG
jgi:hypothetical protein